MAVLVSSTTPFFHSQDVCRQRARVGPVPQRATASAALARGGADERRRFFIRPIHTHVGVPCFTICNVMDIFHGYWWMATYENQVLKCEFSGPGVGAAGAKERTFLAAELVGMAFVLLTLLKNGSITLSTQQGITKLNFRKKDRLEVERLYDLLQGDAPQAFGVAPAGSYQTSSPLAKLGKSLSAKPNTQLMMPNDGTTFARGVSYRQGNLERVGCGDHLFVLLAERNNEHDANAVGAHARKNGKDYLIGYLPSGDTKTKLLWQFCLDANETGTDVVISGEVRPYDSGLGADLHLPSSQHIKEAKAQLIS